MTAGGCQCGAVRYEIVGRPARLYVCHCRECQKQSASAFGMSLTVRRDALRVTGDVADWERATDIGTRTRCFFCPNCGSRVYHQGSSRPDHLTIKAGSLDDTAGLAPSAHIWVSRKQSWVVIPDNVPQHATQPDDLEGWVSQCEGETR